MKKLYRMSGENVRKVADAEDPSIVWAEIAAFYKFDPATVERTAHEHTFYAEPLENGIG